MSTVTVFLEAKKVKNKLQTTKPINSRKIYFQNICNKHS